MSFKVLKYYYMYLSGVGGEQERNFQYQTTFLMEKTTYLMRKQRIAHA